MRHTICCAAKSCHAYVYFILLMLFCIILLVENISQNGSKLHSNLVFLLALATLNSKH